MTAPPTAWVLAVASVAWFAAINAATYLAFAGDKRRARERERRIPERVLLWLAAAGGSPAALLAQRRLRHKTRKQPFGAWLIFVIVAQVTCLVGLYVLLGRL